MWAPATPSLTHRAMIRALPSCCLLWAGFSSGVMMYTRCRSQNEWAHPVLCSSLDLLLTTLTLQVSKDGRNKMFLSRQTWWAMQQTTYGFIGLGVSVTSMHALSIC
jgi:hypothetical protein